MSISVFNRCWSKVILETLVRQGVAHFCIAPGSRSTPLTLEAIRLQDSHRVTCHTHFDERGLGFFALGLAKVSKKPVAVIVTSGTAAANLYPAIIEARQTGVNLIVLTADRPPELIECGANQAIVQPHMYADYPVASVNLPRPSEDYPAHWLIARLDQACYQQANQAGVIHINVPFAEPLYEANETEIDTHSWLESIQCWLNQHKPWIKHQTDQKEVLMHANWDHWRTMRGVIVVGRLPVEQTMGIMAWANTMGWIALTDVQSSVEASLPYADIWLANQTVKQKLLQADIVIQFGSGFISKRVNQFLAAFKQEYWIVEQSTGLIDPNHHAHTRFNAKVHHWLRAHPPLRQKPWLLEPLALSKFCASFIEKQVGGNLNEASLAHHLDRILSNNGILFLGNSLFVRLVDALAKLPEGYPVYTNRGASGIDGLLATAAGIGIGANQPLVAMIGDVSALYDINSLALFKKVTQPTIIFVINNNGGAIFDMLPVEADVKEKYYRMPHHLEFSQLAQTFDLKYARPYTWADLGAVLKVAYSRRETTLIEIKVGASDASTIYKRLIEQISYAVIGE
ncbi:TPA: 2-succinyl-5-enolpyruvyl-6-hydroxy-3-cyclohexene-1-carboxylic-acid synthase [Pasteurella multocida]|uniref:2-succinyl-5-enolpyruvyl-6-hydroxy-3- cyclohexene-1-carboxylic-acid synthase n=1 Tax=Pasteurella multocida TaxID=747 RepID=UPI002CE68AA5|nr:2-succinyl-5-enolpyruvyl-6-hydroxy-3-cyclohexene-1-carboxylic-acid synthase [Pasteurella multocida]MEB3468381.1 2-succinyl-5-enolpyruvyl-6-hydroxy-3-cyclohexene-1-carboxylic-acid synthase [Pasteurella multocida]MEB3499715.1 2-succinyl-5-enolpyruvyl-6-hydroxy-3-cyclohexene-1-carboxylic-acid synthase [Pasteurella multocida]HDR1813766.1 2-succinyl-5-enolpyruvyl-6-hydroxy-3-cyclohexene-1-carboxylic-acid synthase [Pasteurella multocida]HDR1906407.1 2-succinyl-5-enolpyruvyl-6-hydroxy-3-cyclohexene